MQNLIIDSIIHCIPYIIDIFFAIIGFLVYRKLIPYIRSKYSQSEIQNFQEQFDIVMQWTKIFVESAQRLDASGKLSEVINMTKKEYVMEKLMAQIKSLNYSFTEEQLDEIRRSAVLILEQSEKLIKDAGGALTEGTNEQVEGH